MSEVADLNYIAEDLRPLAVGIDSVVVDPTNAMEHPVENLEAIRGSLAKYGQRKPIVVNRNGNVVEAGNGTWRAAKSLGWGHIAAVFVEDDASTAVGYAIADNRTAQLATWDWEVLRRLVEDEYEDPTEVLGIDEEFWSEVLAQTGGDGEPMPDPGPQVDRASELLEKWGVQRGDLWEVGEHRVICGDCTDRDVVGRVMKIEKAGVVMTDPPYGINREGIINDHPDGLRKLFDDVLAIMPVRNAAVIAFQSPRLFWIWLDAVRMQGHKFERMLWMYKPNDETYPWRGWLQKSEAIPVSSVGNPDWIRVDPFAHDCYSPTTLGSELPKEWGKVHASVKPVGVVSDLIARVGGDVYDPFLGSGTTIVACEQLGRRGRGVEIEPKYVAVTLERLSGMGLVPRLVERGG